MFFCALNINRAEKGNKTLRSSLCLHIITNSALIKLSQISLLSSSIDSNFYFSLIKKHQPMENVVTSDHDKLISSFVEIAVGHSMETALQFLKATNWNLEDAINLFLIHRSNHQPLSYQNSLEQNYNHQPLPSRWDTLYDPSMYGHTSVQPVCPERIWDSTTQAEPNSTTQAGPDSMTPSVPDSTFSSLYRPPLDFLFKGLFQDSKSFSSRENLWLLVNIQSKTEFASHALNRDLWSNEAVSQVIKSSFTLLQIYDDTDEGQKVSCFYKIESVPPVVLLIDPITGQKMCTWSGVIDTQSFVEDLMKYMDAGPNQHIASLRNNKHKKPEEITCSPSNKRIKIEKITYSPSNNTVPELYTEEPSETCETFFSYAKEETCLSSDMFEFLVLTEEPKEDCDRSLVCSLCVRFPDGRRKQRKFLKSEPVQLLRSFCYANMEESERMKDFKLVQAIPGASKTLDYEANETFEQSGLDNAMISVTWK